MIIFARASHLNRVAVVLFNRNMTGTPDQAGSLQMSAAEVNGDAAPPLRAGLPVSLGDCSSGLVLSFTTVKNSITVVSEATTAATAAMGVAAAALCLGAIGTCECSNPPSPRIGLVACNASDRTQRWKLDATTNEIDATSFAKVRPSHTCCT